MTMNYWWAFGRGRVVEGKKERKNCLLSQSPGSRIVKIETDARPENLDRISLHSG